MSVLGSGLDVSGLPAGYSSALGVSCDPLSPLLSSTSEISSVPSVVGLRKDWASFSEAFSACASRLSSLCSFSACASRLSSLGVVISSLLEGPAVVMSVSSGSSVSCCDSI